eukprot:scaffold26739_cov21-Tisochrysis_lutea.AAC.2
MPALGKQTEHEALKRGAGVARRAEDLMATLADFGCSRLNAQFHGLTPAVLEAFHSSVPSLTDPLSMTQRPATGKADGPKRTRYHVGSKALWYSL